MNGRTSKLWRYFVSAWTVFIFCLVIFDFVTDNGIRDVLGPVAAVYIATLAIYSTEKEFLRWYDQWQGFHPGEIYVFLWTILLATVLLSDLYLQKPYVVPSEIISTYIAVLGILAVTRQSKLLYIEKCGVPENKKNGAGK